MKLLHLIAHRGDSAEFPENTLPALRSALALGARFIEIDVHLAPDGVPMLCHESVFRGTQVPTVVDAVALLDGRPEITVFVNIGRASVAHFGREQVVAQVLRALRPVRSRCVLISRDLATIHTARARAGTPIGWVVPGLDPHTRLKCEALQPEYLFCESQHLPQHLPRWQTPWKWAAYEPAADLATTLALADRGVDFVVTRHVRALSMAMLSHSAAVPASRADEYRRTRLRERVLPLELLDDSALDPARAA